MSSPTTNPVAWHEASSYATAVRVQLDDLGPDVVEELTGGLEADLLDQAEESTEPLARRLGDPAGYAAELRAAAGLAPRTAPVRKEAFSAEWRRHREDNLATVRRQPWGPTAESVAVQLRPVWWVTRAWVAFQLCDQVLGSRGGAVPSSFAEWVLLLLLAAGSVALGRGLWSTWSGRKVAVRVGNVFAALMLLPALTWVDVDPPLAYGEPVVEEAYAATGLVADGRTVTNVFPYGPDGEPLQGVTLLDQDGEPIAVGADAMPGDQEYDPNGRIRVQVPNWTADGDPAWNVFPMGTASVDADDYLATYYSETDAPGSDLRPPYRSYDDATAPRLRVPAVLLDPSEALRRNGSTPTQGATTAPPTTAPPTTAPPATTPPAETTPPVSPSVVPTP